MATFTYTLAELMEHRGADTVEDALKLSNVVGLDKYPVPSEAYRFVLNEKILRRYWNREIGYETVEMFAFRVDAKLREVMPYYNELYSTTQLEFDPMKTMDLETVSTGKQTHNESGTNLSTNVADSGSRTVNSVTPQMQLSGNGDYADTMADTNSESKNTANASQHGEGEKEQTNTSRTSGYQAIPSDLLVKYRDTIINVDLMILDHLSSLFMAVTSTGDEYLYEQSPYLNAMWLRGWYY